ncbi:MAG: NADH-ubiquinone oxidoreductase-F iron-sulfur binding region domain-containing protein [Cellulomonas sp.]
MTTVEMTIPRAAVAPPMGVNRLFAAGAPDLASHLARFGPVPLGIAPGHLLGELEASGLDGRGGAGFATWRKLVAARTSAGPTAYSAPVVIANGAEGEPMSAKDEILLRHAPHLVLDGLLLAAAVTGAREVHLYSGPVQLASVRRAISERSDARGVILNEAPDYFVSGEASAVVSAIETGSAIPRDRRVRLAVSGLGGRPTVVSNVETLAHVALVARFGAAWFRSVGTDDSPGTRLLTVSGDAVDRKVIEATGGLPLSEALGAVGIDTSRLRAVLVGGYHGAWVPASDLWVRLSSRELEPYGTRPGAGILVALGEQHCGLAASVGIARYLAGQSARQCGPCVNGLPAMAEVLARLAAGGGSARLPDEVRRLAAVVTGRGACSHPDGTARFVLSTLEAFESDVRAHLAGYCEVTRS